MLFRQYLSEFDDTLSILNALHQSQTSLPVSFTEVLVSFKRCALLQYLRRLILVSKPYRLPACFILVIDCFIILLFIFLFYCSKNYFRPSHCVLSSFWVQGEWPMKRWPYQLHGWRACKWQRSMSCLTEGPRNKRSCVLCVLKKLIWRSPASSSEVGLHVEVR